MSSHATLAAILAHSNEKPANGRLCILRAYEPLLNKHSRHVADAAATVDERHHVGVNACCDRLHFEFLQQRNWTVAEDDPVGQCPLRGSRRHCALLARAPRDYRLKTGMT